MLVQPGCCRLCLAKPYLARARPSRTGVTFMAKAGSEIIDAGRNGEGGGQPSPAAAVDFLLLLQSLKTTKRTGWVHCQVAGPESISDHMYRMGIMSMLASDAGVDSSRCVRMALVHDIAEAIVGDITPHCGVSDMDKHSLEAAAIARMQDTLGRETHAAREVAELWHEYEAQESPEAALVKDFDKLEMILQAHEYEAAQGKNLERFFASTAGRFKTPTGRAWAEEVLRRRQQQQQQQQQQQPGSATADAAG